MRQLLHGEFEKDAVALHVADPENPHAIARVSESPCGVHTPPFIIPPEFAFRHMLNWVHAPVCCNALEHSELEAEVPAQTLCRVSFFDRTILYNAPKQPLQG